MNLNAVDCNINNVDVEKHLFEHSKIVTPYCIFILGSPRTGSTILYQSLIQMFQFGFISNLTNDYFGETPALGFSLQVANQPQNQISHTNRFGKTQGLYQPSEGSSVMKKWFGGEHPSQLKSVSVLPNQAHHLINTIKHANYAFNKPFIIKNAWNCFRISTIAQLLPDAFFIWIRRDIEKSAKSDLSARYIVQKNPNTWNSATPWNIEVLKKLPYWEQVVENQYEFNLAIHNDLNQYASSRYMLIWYEDFCQNPYYYALELQQRCTFLNNIECSRLAANYNISLSPKSYKLLEQDSALIDKYLRENHSRYDFFRYKELLERK